MRFYAIPLAISMLSASPLFAMGGLQEAEGGSAVISATAQPTSVSVAPDEHLKDLFERVSQHFQKQEVAKVLEDLTKHFTSEAEFVGTRFKKMYQSGDPRPALRQKSMREESLLVEEMAKKQQYARDYSALKESRAIRDLWQGFSVDLISFLGELSAHEGDRRVKYSSIFFDPDKIDTASDAELFNFPFHNASSLAQKTYPLGSFAGWGAARFRSQLYPMVLTYTGHENSAFSHVEDDILRQALADRFFEVVFLPILRDLKAYDG